MRNVTIAGFAFHSYSRFMVSVGIYDHDLYFSASFATCLGCDYLSRLANRFARGRNRRQRISFHVVRNNQKGRRMIAMCEAFRTNGFHLRIFGSRLKVKNRFRLLKLDRPQSENFVRKLKINEMLIDRAVAGLILFFNISDTWTYVLCTFVSGVQEK